MTDIAQRDLWDEVHAVCTISGPSGSFNADVLLDSGSTMELKLSAYKANQLGLSVTGEVSTSVSVHGTHKTIHKRCSSLPQLLVLIMHTWGQYFCRRPWPSSDFPVHVHALLIPDHVKDAMLLDFDKASALLRSVLRLLGP